MAKEIVRPADSPEVMIMLHVKDIEENLIFYGEAFGFEPKGVFKNDHGKVFHAELYYNGSNVFMLGLEEADIGLSPASRGYTVSFNPYVYVEDVDALHNKAMLAGALELEAPADQFWGDRTTLLQDPSGYRWMFASHLEQK